MEITGRVTADASVQKVNNDKQVVNFSIAINDNYKPKGSTEVKQVVTYIDCSYWLNTKTAQWLKKGTLVQLFGRIGMNVYNNSQGEAAGTLTFHTNNIKILVFPKKTESNTANSVVKKKKSKKTADVPF
ncbi:single-stranded DNA-binding protein [Flavobacterium pectinovorum]|uniref:single-stranded DNA-binding protein n=1 Tax=Flavobacterium pectinovorum TaxID=29533 RepID=UPI001FAB3731|nr:single-stranded DNA-binding protein [Flavobacterium pectinovorum]MCI9843596.1 single-stranded DNA-binding protein [Flavobacterium pectinovorum]